MKENDVLCTQEKNIKRKRHNDKENENNTNPLNNNKRITIISINHNIKNNKSTPLWIWISITNHSKRKGNKSHRDIQGSNNINLITSFNSRIMRI